MRPMSHRHFLQRHVHPTLCHQLAKSRLISYQHRQQMVAAQKRLQTRKQKQQTTLTQRKSLLALHQQVLQEVQLQRRVPRQRWRRSLQEKRRARVLPRSLLLDLHVLVWSIRGIRIDWIP